MMPLSDASWEWRNIIRAIFLVIFFPVLWAFDMLKVALSHLWTQHHVTIEKIILITALVGFTGAILYMSLALIMGY